MRCRYGGRARNARMWCAAAAAAVAVIIGGVAPAAADVLPLDDFSPGFLGVYRKVMEVEDEIRRHAEWYGVDFDLARAVCLYESGGNAGLASVAGAKGYFQVMPRTFRALRVPTNIEAGVKYLSQMIQRFGREDRAVAAYNAGPGAVGRAGGLPLETLQYVIGVGHYRTVLKLYDESLRHHAANLKLATVRNGDDWSALSQRLGIAAWELRLHNPFLAGRRLRAGNRIAYPPEPRRDLLMPTPDGAKYRMRHGDNYFKVAFTLGLDVDALRTENGLWQIQSVPAGVVLRIPLTIDRGEVVRAALTDLGVEPVAITQRAPETASSSPPGPDDLPTDASVRAVLTSSRPADARPGPSVRAATMLVHRVKRGETLTAIAKRYGVTVGAIQEANRLQRRTLIRAGQSLRIPRDPAPEA